MEKNLRGLPPHKVDEWDSWVLSHEEYMEMVTTYDLVQECMEASLADMSLVMNLVEFAARYEGMMQAQEDAGIDI